MIMKPKTFPSMVFWLIRVQEVLRLTPNTDGTHTASSQGLEKQFLVLGIHCPKDQRWPGYFRFMMSLNSWFCSCFICCQWECHGGAERWKQDLNSLYGQLGFHQELWLFSEVCTENNNNNNKMNLLGNEGHRWRFPLRPPAVQRVPV